MRRDRDTKQFAQALRVWAQVVCLGAGRSAARDFLTSLCESVCACVCSVSSPRHLHPQHNPSQEKLVSEP